MRDWGAEEGMKIEDSKPAEGIYISPCTHLVNKGKHIIFTTLSQLSHIASLTDRDSKLVNGT